MAGALSGKGPGLSWGQCESARVAGLQGCSLGLGPAQTRKAIKESQSFAASVLNDTVRALVKTHAPGPGPFDSDPGICILIRLLSW